VPAPGEIEGIGLATDREDYRAPHRGDRSQSDAATRRRPFWSVPLWSRWRRRRIASGGAPGGGGGRRAARSGSLHRHPVRVPRASNWLLAPGVAIRMNWRGSCPDRSGCSARRRRSVIPSRGPVCRSRPRWPVAADLLALIGVRGGARLFLIRPSGSPTYGARPSPGGAGKPPWPTTTGFDRRLGINRGAGAHRARCFSDPWSAQDFGEVLSAPARWAAGGSGTGDEAIGYLLARRVLDEVRS